MWYSVTAPLTDPYRRARHQIQQCSDYLLHEGRLWAHVFSVMNDSSFDSRRNGSRKYRREKGSTTNGAIMKKQKQERWTGVSYDERKHAARVSMTAPSNRTSRPVDKKGVTYTLPALSRHDRSANFCKLCSRIDGAEGETCRYSMRLAARQSTPRTWGDKLLYLKHEERSLRATCYSARLM